MAAWSSGQGDTWTLATPFRLGASQLLSASVGRNGQLGITLNAQRGATLAGPGTSWRPLPALPARTATLVTRTWLWRRGAGRCEHHAVSLAARCQRLRGLPGQYLSCLSEVLVTFVAIAEDIE
jgi:hypothetical protein